MSALDDVLPLLRLTDAVVARGGPLRPFNVRLGQWCPHVYQQTCAGVQYFGAEAMQWTLDTDGQTETCRYRHVRYRDDVQRPGPCAEVPKLMGGSLSVDAVVRALLAAEGIA